MEKGLKLPKEIVAKALGITEDMLNDSSAYGETPNWDSLNHLEIINELEATYQIQIPNADIEKYTSMKAIIELFDTLK